MSKSVAQLATETGRTPEEVLEACRRAGVSAWGPSTILLDGDLRALGPYLGAPAAAAPAAGPPPAPMPPPGAPGMPPPGMPPPGMPPPGMPPPGMPPPGAPLPYGMAPAPRPPKMSRTRVAVVAVGIVVVGILGIVALGNLPEDPETGETALDRLPDIFGPQLPDFEVGDCFDDNSDVPIATGTSLVEAVVEQVPCSGAHDAEVYHLFDHPAPPDTAYPGDGPMFDTAITTCVAEFEPFVGSPYETSALDVYFLAPSPPGFTRLDEREIVCAVVNLDTTPLPPGTARASGR